MKRILSLVVLLLVSYVGFAQAPSNYTNINGRYRWIAGMFDSTFSLPKGTTPSLRTGGSTNPGALFYRTTDSTVKYWTGTQWLTLSDTTRYVPYTGATKNVNLGQYGLNGGYVIGGDTSATTYNVQGASFTPYVFGRKAVTSASSNDPRTIAVLGQTIARGEVANRLVGGAFFTGTDSSNSQNISQLRALQGWTIHNGTGTVTNAWAGYNVISNNQTGTITNAYGSVSGVENRTTGYIPKLHGQSVEVWNLGGGTMDTVFGQTVSIYNSNPASTIGAVYGVSIGKGMITNTGGTHYWRNSGTINRSYGLYLDTSIDVGLTEKYAIYSFSRSNSYFNGKVGIGINTPDSALTVAEGALFQRGVRMSGLLPGAGTKALRIDAIGNITYSDTLVDAGGTVTSVATNNGTGITGGTITGSGTIAADTLLLSTRAWRQKGVDSVAALANSKVSSVGGTSPISSSGGTSPTISISQAGASSNGFLSSTDWNTFNNKQNALTNPVTGTGTTNYIPKFTSSSAIGNSVIYDNGGEILINTTSDAGDYKLQVNGNVYAAGSLAINTSGQTRTITTFYGAGSIGQNIFIGGGGLLSGTGGGANTLGSNNTALGVNSFLSNTTGYLNCALGVNALYNNTTGYQNNAIGVGALQDNTTGNQNNAIGQGALLSNTTGSFNSALGHQALFSNTTGIANSAIGLNSIFANTTGYENTAMGVASLQNNTTGYYNSAFGRNAGRYVTAGTNNTTSNNSVYLGYDTRASADGNTNEIVIGSGARGDGSNTIRLGNTSITGVFTSGAITGASFIPTSSTVPTNGLYLPAANTLGFATNSGEKMRLDASGNLGLGTSSPNVSSFSRALTISSANSGLELTSATNVVQGVLGANTLGLSVSGVGTAGIRFFTSASGATSERMRLDASGNLGLGVTPEAWTTFNPVLRIKNASTAGGGALASSGISNFRMFANAFYDGAYKYIGTGAATQYEQDGYHAWSTAPSGTAGTAITFTERMRITSGGGVGINGTSPSGSLDIYGNTGTKVRIGYFTDQSTDDPTLRMFDGKSTRPSYSFTSDNTSGMFGGSGFVAFSTSASERMRLTSSGELLINTTSDVGDYKLQVNGNVYANGNGLIGGSASLVTSQGVLTSSSILQIFNGGGAGSNIDKIADVILANSSSYTDGTIARLIGVNNAITTADKRIAQISFINNAAINSGAISFSTLNAGTLSTKMIINAAGNVGIGTTSPSEKLEVNGAIKTAAPSGGTAKPWKLGELVTTGVTVDTTKYIRVEIDGVEYYLATVTIN